MNKRYNFTIMTLSLYILAIYSIKYTHGVVLVSFVEVISLYLSDLYDLFTHIIQVDSQALGQSYDCPSASEATLKDMGKTFVCFLGCTTCLDHHNTPFTDKHKERNSAGADHMTALN